MPARPLVGLEMTPEHARLCRELAEIWYQQIPLTRALDLRVQAFDGHSLEVAADLAPNVNVHGTAFAGSLYSINALCGWSLVHLQLQLSRLDASIVIAEGQISYLRPVAETIVARCEFGDQQDALERLQQRGRARLVLTSETLAEGAVAVEFHGNYGVMLRSQD